MISWGSKKQRTMADSSCYAEYVALHEASREAIFLCELLTSLNLESSLPTPLYCDNDAATQLTEDHKHHPWVKHIQVCFHYIQDMVDDGELKVTRVSLAGNTADVLTKPLSHSDFQCLCHYLGVRQPPGAPSPM